MLVRVIMVVAQTSNLSIGKNCFITDLEAVDKHGRNDWEEAEVTIGLWAGSFALRHTMFP